MLANLRRAARLVVIDTVAAFCDTVLEQMSDARQRTTGPTLDTFEEAIAARPDPGVPLATVIHLPLRPESLAATMARHPSARPGGKTS